MPKLISLTKGFEAIVDDDDFDWLSQWHWRFNQGYAVRTCMKDGRAGTILMHRAILESSDGMVTDHINRNPLDNRRENLRLATHGQNRSNSPKHLRNSRASSPYKGVTWSAQLQKWIAQIAFDRKVRYIGLFINEIEAAKAYDAKAREVFGEFAYLNFPADQSPA